MFEGAKTLLGSKLLNRKLASVTRLRAFTSLDEMKSVGILFEYTENLYPIANRAIKFFKSKRIATTALAFRNIKTEETSTFIQSFDIKLFMKNDLNWYGKPSGAIVDDFLAQKFDVLIDLTRSDLYMYRYILCMSKAKCKIGGVQYKDDPFDLILLDKTADADKFITQTLNFLSSIK